MTRMVEEERTQIGTLKALGYSKTSIAMKYILYAFLATFFGSILGFLIGEQLFPRVIITAYKILYRNIPKVVSPFNAYYAALATTLAILCVGLATYLSCYKELLSKPSQLMRPVAPKNGKRVILERLPFLWKRLSFSQKATIRNLLRYKKRFFMTVFGIGACMALLLVGFGLKDSIFVIYDRQFDEIMLYDASVSVEQEATESQQEQLKSILEDHSEINSFLKIKQGTIDISYQGVAKNINYIIPADPKKFQNYVVMRNRVSHTSYNLEEDGVMLTEQVAKQLDIHAGDTLIIEDGDHNKVEVTVRSITENYMSHYLYMTPKLYEKLFKKDLEYNGYLLTMKNVNQEKQYQIGEDLLNVDGVSSIFYVSKLSERLENILSSLNIVVVVLTISAGALAFVVLYNLNNINIKERRRELATIKLLGFYNSELAFYVYRENILLTIIGSFVGAFLGWLLHQYVITTVEIDQVMFGRNIDISSYLYGILLTFLFSIFVNLVMFYKLKKIDMVESLKSVE
jgi:putative ABC transport system permease protein